MSKLAVAEEIAKQLGGTNALIAMIGAKNILGDENSLQFQFGGKATNGANSCVITLDQDDTYTVRFVKLSRAPSFAVTEKGTTSMVYNVDLRTHFEKSTGFYLKL